MESSTRSGIDLAAQRTFPGLALILAVLSVPGSTAAWDLFDGAGFAIGMPLAIAAIVLGVQARRAQNGRGQATAAIVIAGAMVALTVVWTLASV